ncbi:F-box protein SKP2B [Frankliniella fusca]|uniref:F-box protein SKP2B n=1 Tax=Frankliniella fusca TaxID=407009 RepID=A0AAE1LUC6_9NEOP|nr:F-box protein SKP2B [Frankliniella fusca]
MAEDPHNLPVSGVAVNLTAGEAAQVAAEEHAASAALFARSPPLTLFLCAANALADWALSCVLKSPTPEARDAIAAKVRGLVASMPASLADSLVGTLVKRYVSLQGEDNDGAPGDAQELIDLLGEGVTTVDLSPLVRMGRRSTGDMAAFSARLATALPRLAHLTRLSLGTHGQRYTLPVCSDNTLAAVARVCHSLVALDVSRNAAVSAGSLTMLCAGCPLLEELLIYDCVLPCGVLAGLLQALPRLRLLGHQEVGAAVLLLWLQNVAAEAAGEDCCRWGQSNAPLAITQVVNTGETALHRRRSLDEPTRLRCRGQLVRALRGLCPQLEELRVRVLDEDLRHFGHLSHLQRLELRYHAAAKPSSLGPVTLKFLAVHGARLTVLTVYSHALTSGHFDLVGEHCPQLRQLWMRCNVLTLTETSTTTTRPFSRLENLSLRVGWDERSVSHLPASFVQRLVRNAERLRQLYVAVNSADVTDAWLAAVLDAMDCSALVELFVLLPNNNASDDAPFAPRLALTPASVRAVRARCPALEQLGNLLVWSFQQEEVRHLQDQLRASNCVLRLVAKETVWR